MDNNVLGGNWQDRCDERCHSQPASVRLAGSTVPRDGRPKGRAASGLGRWVVQKHGITHALSKGPASPSRKPLLACSLDIGICCVHARRAHCWPPLVDPCRKDATAGRPQGRPCRVGSARSHRRGGSCNQGAHHAAR
jgi:hypothetical protein